MTTKIESQEAIEAGKVYDILKGISTAFTDLFKFLNECSVKAKDAQPITDNEGKTIGELFTAVTKQGNQIKIKLVQSSGRKDLYDMYCLAKNGKKKAYPQIKVDKIDDKLSEFAKEAYDEELVTFDQEDFDVDDEFADMDFSSAKKLQVELVKIQGSEEVQLGKVYCNYDPCSAFDDLDEILDSNELNELIKTEPQCLEIIPQENAYLINQIDNVEYSDSACEILKAQYKALILLENCMVSKCSIDYNPYDFINKINWQKEWLLNSSLCKDACCNVVELISSLDFSALKADISDPRDITQQYASTIDLYYGNFPHEVQTLLDDWLLTLRYDRCY